MRRVSFIVWVPLLALLSACGDDATPESTTPAEVLEPEPDSLVVRVGLLSYWGASEGLVPDAPGNHVYTFEVLEAGEVSMALDSSEAPGHLYLRNASDILMESEDTQPDNYLSALAMTLEPGTYNVVPVTQEVDQQGLFQLNITGAIANVTAPTLFCTESTPCRDGTTDTQIIAGVCTRNVMPVPGLGDAKPVPFLCDVNDERADLHLAAMKDTTLSLVDMAKDNGVAIVTMYLKEEPTLSPHLLTFVGDVYAGELSAKAGEAPPCGHYAKGAHTFVIDEGQHRWRSELYQSLSCTSYTDGEGCTDFDPTDPMIACNADDFWINGGECQVFDVSPIYTACTGEFGQNDDPFYVEPNTGTQWVPITYPTHTELPWGEAVKACEDLLWAGRDDWVLPSIDNLRDLVRNCPVTEVGGACPANGQCTDWITCQDSSDCTCGHMAGICRIPTAFLEMFEWEKCGGYFWSSTVATENGEPVEGSWYLDVDYGAIGAEPHGTNGAVMCARKP